LFILGKSLKEVMQYSVSSHLIGP